MDSINRIDRLYTRRLRAIKLLAVGKNYGGFAGLRLKLFLAALGCSLNKAFDGWTVTAPGYRKLYRQYLQIRYKAFKSCQLQINNLFCMRKNQIKSKGLKRPNEIKSETYVYKRQQQNIYIKESLQQAFLPSHQKTL